MSTAGKGRYAGDTFVRNLAPAVRPAAIAFDLLTILGLLVLGRRLRAGPEGRVLGVGLAYAWASYPYALYALESNTNDALVSALLVLALIVFARPSARVTGIGLATAAKFAPGILIPLFALADGGRRARRVALYSAVAGGVGALLLLLVDSHLVTGMYDAVDYQVRRSSPFSVWGRDPSLAWLQVLCGAGAIGLALGVAFVPKTKTAAQVAALGAAVLVAGQFALGYWLYFYIIWFAPYAVVALFSEYSDGAHGASVVADEAPKSAVRHARATAITTLVARAGLRVRAPRNCT